MSGSSTTLSEKEVQDIMNPTTFKQMAKGIFYNILYPGIKERKFIEVKSILLQDVTSDIKKSLGKRVTIVIKSDLEGNDCKVLLGSSGIFSDSEIFIPYLLVEWFGDSLMTSCSGKMGDEVAKMLLDAGFDKAYKVMQKNSNENFVMIILHFILAFFLWYLGEDIFCPDKNMGQVHSFCSKECQRDPQTIAEENLQTC